MVWDAACSSQVESPVLYVPSGYSFMVQSTIFTGPCQGGIVFQVNSELMPPDGPESWPKGLSRRQWLVFYQVVGMSLLVIYGLIDRKGEKWRDLPCKPHKEGNGTTLPGPCDSPIVLHELQLNSACAQKRNSPQFHFRFDNCRNVHIDSIFLSAPLGPNADGIHIENTIGVKIYNSVISNGDDCVSIGSGCYNVYVWNITCGPSHGIRQVYALRNGIMVRDSAIKSSDKGVRIKTWRGSGAVSRVTFDNIFMDNVRNPIIIDQFYCLAKECTNHTSAVLVSDVLYTNIKGTYDVHSSPMHFACSDLVPCTNITISDIELLPDRTLFVGMFMGIRRH
ncbi:hypothetical protein ACJRO7_030274 [Eucalyptus globulus]|uniref:Polygalacturonase n=1 Tax=Eucalyptus globulus TaxID=34317 RepID=A0ABD3JEQ1_EUCGL